MKTSEHILLTINQIVYFFFWDIQDVSNGFVAHYFFLVSIENEAIFYVFNTQWKTSIKQDYISTIMLATKYSLQT